MSNQIDIAQLYREFEDAFVDVLAETEFEPARRSRLLEARDRLHSHPDFSSTGYVNAVDMAFERRAAVRRA